MGARIWKHVNFFGQPVVVGCDAKCDKAWGINQRPRIQFSRDHDDYAYRTDAELGTAPDDPGTYEGGDAKPTLRPMTGEAMNKWCVRECERSDMADSADELDPSTFDVRHFNMPHLHESP